MKRIGSLTILLVFIFITTILSSCKSSFSAVGTPIECNEQWIKPVLNPTQKAEFIGGHQAMDKFIR